MTYAEPPLQHSFASLPPAFYTRLQPSPMPAPYLVGASAAAAGLIGLDPAQFGQQDFAEMFGGNRMPESAQPLAAVYSGHQFGVWAGQLGDGRAILLGDCPGPDGPLELQLKGAGRTPYSRMGDGRAVLRSSIREFLCSEAMAALGVPTSRALCVVGSDMHVMREQPEPAAVATRLAPSWIRFGSFEHWYYSNREAELKTLADYVLARFHPDLLESPQPYQALLARVARQTADMVAHWQAVGFMHGVMNTDNMSILGLTIDYGPFGFMEAYDPGHICNHSDGQGRYAYDMQPQIGFWNCCALAQAMLPLVGEVAAAQEAVEQYQIRYQEQFSRMLRAKLGLQSQLAGDQALMDVMFAAMQEGQADFTLFFRRLGQLRLDDPAGDAPLRALFADPAPFDAWAGQYRQRLRQEGSQDAPRRLAMDRANPKYVLRNWLAQEAIEKAQRKDFSGVADLLAVLEHPFDEQEENGRYAMPPPAWACGLEVSCSS